MRRRVTVWGALLCAVAVAMGSVGCATDTQLDESQLSLLEADGGLDYFSPQLTPPDIASRLFPLAIWQPTLVDETGVERLQAAHMNGVVAPTAATDRSVLDNSGLWSIDNSESVPSVATAGWFIGDEFDMRFGPGRGSNEGVDPRAATASCPSSACGYTVLDQVLAATPKDDRLRYANFGKGVLFWETNPEARQFVNTTRGITSADAYWYTDNNLCQVSEGSKLLGLSESLSRSECRRAYNYSLTVERMRSLVRPTRSRPVWAFVELGHPFSQNDWPDISGREIRAAAWASIIAGARGIVYFNNSFGGRCPTADVLGSPCSSRAALAVSNLNAEIEQLAPIINSPSVLHFVKQSDAVYATTRFFHDSLYIFAVNKSDQRRRATFSVPCSTSPSHAQVLFERRNLRSEGAVFHDVFQDAESVHIYKITGLSGCKRDTNG